MPFGEPAALSRLELRTGSEAVQAAFSRGKAAPPWQGTRQSHGWAPRGEQLFPKGAGVLDAMGIPNRMWHTWHESPTPGHLCAALIHHGDPEHHLRSATSGRFRNANGWEDRSLSSTVRSCLAHFTCPSFLITSIYARPSVPRGQKTSPAHGRPGECRPTAPPAPGPRHLLSGNKADTTERVGQGYRTKGRSAQKRIERARLSS